VTSRRKGSIGTQGPPPPDGGDISDRRAAFARETRKSGRDEEAERAFIEGKMAMVRSDPNLTDEEKRRALAELRLKLERPPPR
jgi:hypothetical protein